MSSIDPNWEVTVHDVKRMLDAKEDFLLLDVRGPDEYAIASIDGARLVPLGDLPSALPSLQDYADRKIVAHCHHGGRSMQAAVFLREHGFTNVKSMAGGIDAWSQQIDPSQPRY